MRLKFPILNRCSTDNAKNLNKLTRKFKNTTLLVLLDYLLCDYIIFVEVITTTFYLLFEVIFDKSMKNRIRLIVVDWKTTGV